MRALILITVLATCALALKFSIRKIVWRLDDTVEERIIIKGTTWIAEIRSNRCVLSCNGYQGTNIRLVNETAEVEVKLVEGADVIDDQLTSDAQGELKITLANLTVATLHDVTVPGVNIVWNFLPKNDPIARAAHDAWVFGDKKSTAAREWYCANDFLFIPSDHREASDKSLALGIFGSQSNQKHYCLKN